MAVDLKGVLNKKCQSKLFAMKCVRTFQLYKIKGIIKNLFNFRHHIVNSHCLLNGEISGRRGGGGLTGM
jgi:hypothetical protein